MSPVPVSAVIPTLNPGAHAEELIRALHVQTVPLADVIIMDSGSTDGSPDRFRNAGFTVFSVPREQFDHGATRELGLDRAASEFVVFLTQDACPADPDALRLLADPLQDASVGMSFGRQSPRPGACPIERHALEFNYGEKTVRKKLPDARKLGIYPAHARVRKSLGEMTRKLSDTASQ